MLAKARWRFDGRSRWRQGASNSNRARLWTSNNTSLNEDESGKSVSRQGREVMRVGESEKDAGCGVTQSSQVSAGDGEDAGCLHDGVTEITRMVSK